MNATQIDALRQAARYAGLDARYSPTRVENLEAKIAELRQELDEARAQEAEVADLRAKLLEGIPAEAPPGAPLDLGEPRLATNRNPRGG